IANSGLTSNGKKNNVPSVPKLTPVPTAVRPAPTSAPTRPCVVDTGKPVNVASITVRPAPRPTAKTNCGEAASSFGTMPRPEKFLSSVSARKSEVIDPANVEIVAHVIADL